MWLAYASRTRPEAARVRNETAESLCVLMRGGYEIPLPRFVATHSRRPAYLLMDAITGRSEAGGLSVSVSRKLPRAVFAVRVLARRQVIDPTVHIRNNARRDSARRHPKRPGVEFSPNTGRLWGTCRPKPCSRFSCLIERIV